MTARHGTDDVIASWLEGEATAGAPERLLRASRERIQSTQQRRAWWQGRPRIDTRGVARFALAATAVVAVAVVGLRLWSANGGDVGVGPVATPSPSPAPSVELPRIPGLPPEGTTPSDAAPGELVLEFTGTASGKSIWVYADGRMIWNSFFHRRAGIANAYVGFSEQRLTPSGVEYLRSEVDSSGLFKSDLLLAREGDAPFLRVRLLKGERLVQVTWAWRGISGDAPVATAEQESALTMIEALLTHPASWPDGAWEDSALTNYNYVPSEYVVCFGILHGDDLITPRPLDVMTLLPEGARSLVRIGDRTPQESMHADYGCARLTTEDAITFARVLDDAGIERNQVRDYLSYRLTDPSGPSDVWIQFGAVLPHDVAIYLGPG